MFFSKMLENYCATYKKTNTKFGCPLIFEYIKSKKPPRIETNKIRYILYMGRCECGCGGKVGDFDLDRDFVFGVAVFSFNAPAYSDYRFHTYIFSNYFCCFLMKFC